MSTMSQLKEERKEGKYLPYLAGEKNSAFYHKHLLFTIVTIVLTIIFLGKGWLTLNILTEL